MYLGIILAIVIVVSAALVYYMYAKDSACASASAEAEADKEDKDANKKHEHTRRHTYYDASKNPFDTSNNLILEQSIQPPYAMDSMQSVDDYEYSMIFQNEGDKAMTKATRDRLMSAYPMDWATQPPSSDLFQQGLAAYKESFTNPTHSNPLTQNPYKSVDGTAMTPPDYDAVEHGERDILATYVPKKPGDLTTYDAADAKELVDKIYKAKGLVPQLRKTGNNVFTIVGTHKVNEKVMYEDEASAPDASGSHAPTSSVAVASAGEGTIDVPKSVSDYTTVDPFFTPSESSKTRDGKWDYTSWTPGLERMFAPTDPQVNWY
jgi:hypothetical protein